MLNIYKPNSAEDMFNLDFVWNKNQEPPPRLARFLVDVPDFRLGELQAMKSVRKTRYFDIKVENKKKGYRVSLDRHVSSLIVVEVWNGNYWVDCKSYYGKRSNGNSN